jgi:hypothetical protein
MTPTERLDALWRLLSEQYNQTTSTETKASLRAQMLSVVSLQIEHTRLLSEHHRAKPTAASIDPTFVKAVAEAITLLDASKLESFAG